MMMRKHVRILMGLGLLMGIAFSSPLFTYQSVLAQTSPLATPTRSSPLATPTRVPPTATRVAPTSTLIPPTPTQVPPTATSSPTATTLPPTPTWVPPTATSSPTSTTLPPTATYSPSPTQMPPTATRTVPAPTSMPGAAILGYHEVRSSETLYCVARAYGVLPSGIASENGIPYPYALKAGQLLAIPNLPWKSMPGGPTCQRQFISACRLTHVVQRGDTLYSIAARYQTTVWAVVNDNHITNPSTIMPGQKLCIR